MKPMVNRETARWRVIYDADFGRCLPYIVEYRINGEWKRWTSCETRWGARYAMWKAKRISMPIGGQMIIYQEGK